ncbi:MAG: Stp1/IreP family PP2C-type Ser/Thr phosphatase [Acidobacteria bacterium]|nr:Stp1/IreP family PP2C-type Ser/Thr phosphatase [Acidobacteriota bacterium]
MAEARAGKMSYRSAGLSDVGRKRASNEDSFSIDPRNNLYVVADGMGGHAAGEVASRLAVESIERHISGSDPRNDPTFPASMRSLTHQEEALPIPARRVLTAIRLANQEIMRSVRKDQSMRGMGTTVVIALIQDDRAHIGSVGDSRVYLLRGKVMRQLTSDHTFVNEQMRAGAISAEEARRHPARNVLTRAVGSQEEVEVDLIEQELQNGDILLLCSDGLTSMAEDDEIQNALQHVTSDIDTGCKDLIDLANSRGGDDNVTVVLVRAAPPGS